MTNFQTYLYPNTVNIETCFEEELNFSEIIDVRSPNEFNEDHIPTAKNFPVLDNFEREKIGIEYKKDRLSAKKLGASLIAKNISSYLENEWFNKDINWKPLIYCWRGGERSKSLSHILSRIGFKVYLIDGGYKSYRKFVINKISEFSPKLNLNVICGLTGSGKTKLLKALKIKGNQIIDLEEIANHCGSILGEHPLQPQPSQKLFESLLVNELKSLDLTKKIFIESESKKIGDRHVPDDLINVMRQSDCIWIDIPKNERVNNLKNDYQHLINNQKILKLKLKSFNKFTNKNFYETLMTHFENMEWSQLIKTLLEKHYDPLYLESITKNYKKIKNSKKIKFKNIKNYSLLAEELSS